MECKSILDTASLISLMSPLIEPEWNVNIRLAEEKVLVSFPLIEPEWNVNPIAHSIPSLNISPLIEPEWNVN